MLSRIAEAMFWIGRYVERAEATTRMLIEHHQLLVEDTRLDPAVGVEAMLQALSLMPEDPEPGALTPATLIQIVVGESGDPKTVLGSVAAARENARTIREALPIGMFERMNATHLRMQAGISTTIPGIPLSGLLDELVDQAARIRRRLPEGWESLEAQEALADGEDGMLAAIAERIAGCTRR